MKSVKPVIQRVQAEQDVEQALDYYLKESVALANSFIDDLERTFEHIRKNSAIGSPRYAHELNLPNLRSWMLKRFPHIIFYIERPDCIDVWRVLHGKMDIPDWMMLSD